MMTPLGTMNWTMSTRALAQGVSSCGAPGEGSPGSLTVGFGGTGEGLVVVCEGGDHPLPISGATLLPSPRQNQREWSQRLGSK